MESERPWFLLTVTGTGNFIILPYPCWKYPLSHNTSKFASRSHRAVKQWNYFLAYIWKEYLDILAAKAWPCTILLLVIHGLYKWMKGPWLPLDQKILATTVITIIDQWTESFNLPFFFSLASTASCASHCCALYNFRKWVFIILWFSHQTHGCQ